ncbi:CHAT domain-containing protein [Mycolicibacterium austroafricanum]|uniref:CHAT domain-containing protein n=1 Tax=Mycolicibacterium austroafricanum TaxID=39687 RepID=A0ABT8HE03_MYCAO|nr:CHAT domain-containing protein [Mycolicibacterium austroafricanum]MDN4518993.1 CHAT domain-containing protein [Mycolicibacterium austroafricanum]QRZ04502.1 CHAT domain-containing protein [Mycolicibacterium austroafricanum]QZT66243.1 CHAT domain-containing protein [Mycolicibacterium austroafricanum]
MEHVAMTDAAATLVLRYADVGVATYAGLRVVGQPDSTVTWVIEEPALAEALGLLADALPDPRPSENVREALERAFTAGSFATATAEQQFADILGRHLISAAGWDLITRHSARQYPALFVAPTARLAQVPWSLLAIPGDDPRRLLELADILVAAPPNIANAARTPAQWDERRDNGARLLILDPRVPGQRPDSALGSVLGRPDPDGALTRHFAELRARCEVLPDVASTVELFRSAHADRGWLAAQLTREPSRLLFVGHATAADGDVGHADRAALHLADEQPLTAADLMTAQLAIPPRAALLACSSGGDYRFDEATGLVAALILGGALVVTATLWSLPTAAGYRQFCPAADASHDPMAAVVIAVDTAHEAQHAGRAVNAWQRAQLTRWRAGDDAAAPLYWAALVTFAVDGAR